MTHLALMEGDIIAIVVVHQYVKSVWTVQQE